MIMTWKLTSSPLTRFTADDKFLYVLAGSYPNKIFAFDVVMDL
jgi:hypothetical protein